MSIIAHLNKYRTSTQNSKRYPLITLCIYDPELQTRPEIGEDLAVDEVFNFVTPFLFELAKLHKVIVEHGEKAVLHVPMPNLRGLCFDRNNASKENMLLHADVIRSARQNQDSVMLSNTISRLYAYEASLANDLALYRIMEYLSENDLSSEEESVVKEFICEKMKDLKKDLAKNWLDLDVVHDLKILPRIGEFSNRLPSKTEAAKLVYYLEKRIEAKGIRRAALFIDTGKIKNTIFNYESQVVPAQDDQQKRKSVRRSPFSTKSSPDQDKRRTKNRSRYLTSKSKHPFSRHNSSDKKSSERDVTSENEPRNRRDYFPEF